MIYFLIIQLDYQLQLESNKRDVVCIILALAESHFSNSYLRSRVVYVFFCCLCLPLLVQLSPLLLLLSRPPLLLLLFVSNFHFSSLVVVVLTSSLVICVQLPLFFSCCCVNLFIYDKKFCFLLLKFLRVTLRQNSF
jgi:hypothetical protein